MWDVEADNLRTEYPFHFRSIASQAGSESGAHVHQRRRSRPVDRSWNVSTRVRVGSSLEEAHFILEGKPEFGELDFPGLLV